MLILLLIGHLCSTEIETNYLCKERVKACYDLNKELSDLPKKEIAKLCYGTYVDNNGANDE